MYRQYAWSRFQSTEGSVTELISTADLQGKMCDLHRIAVQTHHISDNYTSSVTKANYAVTVTDTENMKLLFLEKNLDFCVLKARRNKPETDSVPRNENTSLEPKITNKQLNKRIATMKNGEKFEKFLKEARTTAKEKRTALQQWILLKPRVKKEALAKEEALKQKRTGDQVLKQSERCGEYGDISFQDYADEFKVQEESLQTNADYTEFEMVNLDDEFGGHWSRKDTSCDSNSFNFADASRFNLNNTRFSFIRYKKHLDDIKRKLVKSDYADAWNSVSQHHAMSDYKSANGYRMSDKFKKEYDNFNDELNLEDITFGEPCKTCSTQIKPPVEVTFVPRAITSKYGVQECSETLLIDSRLLEDVDKYKFASMEIPPMLMGTVLRSGHSDYHCVYFEDKNAMGQLTSHDKHWATILIVRPDQAQEYVYRYASEHTYIVQLPDRATNDYLKGMENADGVTGKIANAKSYSAGDSKFYCWRVAQWLHEQWGTPSDRRRCIIGDDQIYPFQHQVPLYNNDATVNSDEMFSENDQYAFRSTLLDKENRSMMARGSERFFITHAATFRYMDKVSTIMNAGIVSLNSGPGITTTNFPLKSTPWSNCIWLINFDVWSNANVGGAKIDKYHLPYLQSALNPAYQAAEDIMMFRIAQDRGVRLAACSTIRWRKTSTKKNSTAGRGELFPMRPIIKYHDMIRAVKFFRYVPALKGVKVKVLFPPVYRVKSWPFSKIARPDYEISDGRCWPFSKIAWMETIHTKSKKRVVSHVWVQKDDITAFCEMPVNPNALIVNWGDATHAESEIKMNDGQYGQRHRLGFIILKILDAIVHKNLSRGGDQLAARPMGGGVGETKTSAKKKKKPRRADSNEDDAILQPRKLSERYTRRTSRYIGGATDEEIEAADE